MWPSASSATSRSRTTSSRTLSACRMLSRSLSPTSATPGGSSCGRVATGPWYGPAEPSGVDAGYPATYATRGAVCSPQRRGDPGAESASPGQGGIKEVSDGGFDSVPGLGKPGPGPRTAGPERLPGEHRVLGAAEA